MTKTKKEKQKQDIQKAEDYVRQALSAVSKKPISEAKVKQVAKKVARTMSEVLVSA